MPRLAALLAILLRSATRSASGSSSIVSSSTDGSDQQGNVFFELELEQDRAAGIVAVLQFPVGEARVSTSQLAVGSMVDASAFPEMSSKARRRLAKARRRIAKRAAVSTSTDTTATAESGDGSASTSSSHSTARERRRARAPRS